MDLKVNKCDPPLSALILITAAKEKITVTWSDANCLTVDGVKFDSNSAITRYLGRATKSHQWFGNGALEESEVNHWITYSQTMLVEGRLKKALEYLDNILAPVTYLVGNKTSLGDIVVWSKLYSIGEWSDLMAAGSVPTNVDRWFKTIANLDFVIKTLKNMPGDVKIVSQTLTGETGRKEEGKFVDLPGAEMGKVVVRFPPEASGYLHIGHAKAALLNQYYQQNFNGKLIMRFDDTNPAKEKEDFEKVILEDLQLLHVKYDQFTHTSDYFDLMLELCEKLIKQSKAYVDDTDPEVMKAEREQKVESKNRNKTVNENLALWAEMKSGTPTGQKCCVRAKIDMSSPNGCLRDPTIYRCKNELHPKTGSKYKVYPTYDFACPIVDSIEGVTHCLRTMEYHDRDDQFYWFIDALNLRKPYIWEYARLNMTNTVLSKRKLTWFVESGFVEGWDDPRMPTVRGVLRRGMTVEGLRQFIIAQGSSKSVVFMEWDKIWAINKKIIDPIAPRYTAVEAGDNILVEISGVKEAVLEVSKHPKNNDVGTKQVWLSSQVFVDKADAVLFKEGENVTFINWGNIKIKNVVKQGNNIVKVIGEPNLEDKNFKKTMKITWLAKTPKAPFIPCICVYFDHIISKSVLGKDEDFKNFIGSNTKIEVDMIGDPDLAKIKKSEIIQLQRKGFFICDRPYEKNSIHTGLETPIVLFSIPDGHTKIMPTTIPQAISKAAPSKPKVETISVDDIEAKISSQGNKVRDLKAQKAVKTVIEGEVKILLELKTQYKTKTGKDWVPSVVSSEPSKQSDETLSLLIESQGNKVRDLKSAKAAKDVIGEEVKTLLALKADYKAKTGKDWTPPKNPTQAKTTVGSSDESLSIKIEAQGNRVRDLKTAKAAKDVIGEEVKTLLALKAEYKIATGNDWTPNDSKTASSGKASSVETKKIDDESNLSKKITSQGEKVRNLKNAKATKNVIDEEVKVLLAMKNDYKTLTGNDFSAPGSQTSDNKTSSKNSSKKEKENKKLKPEKTDAKKGESAGPKKITRLGLEASKATNLPDWYSQVITKGELIEYYDISGCYILRPWSFSVWEEITHWLDKKLKSTGVKNCYFPIFVSKAALEKEKSHVEDFSPEVAWVTKSGDSDLAEPIAIRPTSETVMYPSYAKWIQSHRDLPIKLNQWNNVVRWEFKHPQPFLRTREFLWQEGHSAFASLKEAEEEVHLILDFYANVYTHLLAIPVVKGRKTEKEKFAGGDYTLTVEAFISASGRGIQGATSHHLGQNFSKMCEIIYEDPETQEKKFVYQNSWGLTTRTIGVMIMVHSDDQGLVMPPRVAPSQIVIVPCGITSTLPETEKVKLLGMCQNLTVMLTEAGIRVEADLRDNYSPGWKFNHWELKGVPLRIEVGPKDMAADQVVAVRRDTGAKAVVSMKGITTHLSSLLDNIQSSMYKKALDELTQHMVICTKWSELMDNLEAKNIIQAPFCGRIECEDKIKDESAKTDVQGDAQAPAMGAKSLCIPFEPIRPLSPTDRCIHPCCDVKPKFICLFGRSY